MENEDLNISVENEVRIFDDNFFSVCNLKNNKFNLKNDISCKAAVYNKSTEKNLVDSVSESTVIDKFN